MTDNGGARADEPRPSPTEPHVEESALDPAGHHTPEQEQVLAEQAQADEDEIERVGDETAEREIEASQTPNAGGNGTPEGGEDVAARADAEVQRRLIEEDSRAAAPDPDDADDLDI